MIPAKVYQRAEDLAHEKGIAVSTALRWLSRRAKESRRRRVRVGQQAVADLERRRLF